ncbi:MAG TPA: CheR family methyltransferase [Candidatus Limnocylindria bacterium]|nr:CheR family methyltransferase [Candidatus Limnocylindria bacterium]
MTDFETFLVEVLPPLGLAPAALVRRNIRRRVMRRMESVGVHDFSSYLLFLRRNPSEWDVLRPLFTVTISRFFRNRRVFDALSRHVLAPLAAKGNPVFAWSAGCASGEEAFTLRILWEELPGRKPPMSILATDVAGACLQRAGEGLYTESSLREVPRSIVEKYFLKEEGRFRLREDVVRSVTFRDHDLMGNPPSGAFHLVLCRNAAFTYFAVPRRVPVARAIASVLFPGGFLVIGRTETLPLEAAAWFAPACLALNIFNCLGSDIAPIP